MEDARAIERDCPSVALVDVWLGATGFNQSRIYYGHEKTRRVAILGATENWAAADFAKLEAGRPLIPPEAEHPPQGVLLRNNPWQALVPHPHPPGETGRTGAPHLPG